MKRVCDVRRMAGSVWGILALGARGLRIAMFSKQLTVRLAIRGVVYAGEVDVGVVSMKLVTKLGRKQNNPERGWNDK